MRTRHTVLAAGTVAFAVLATTATAAEAASSTIRSCKSGKVCYYDYNWGPGSASNFLKKSSSGDINADTYGTAIFNNGNKYPGGDHIWFSGRAVDQGTSDTSSSTVLFRGCLHYNTNRSSANKASWADLRHVQGVLNNRKTNYKIYGAWWGGECTSDRPVLEQKPVGFGGKRPWETLVNHSGNVVKSYK
ncbi:hypothetical protein ACX6XY_14655 [Streptomyces sp. O3]